MDRERDRRPSYRERYPPDGGSGGSSGYRVARSPPRQTFRSHNRSPPPPPLASRRPYDSYHHPPPPGPPGPPPASGPYPPGPSRPPRSLGGRGDFRRSSRSPPGVGGYRGDGPGHPSARRRFSPPGGLAGGDGSYRARSPPRIDGRYRGRERSPPPSLKRSRDASPVGMRSNGIGPGPRSPMMGGPPLKRERLDSPPPRERFPEPRARGQSPPRRTYSPPRDRGDYRPRSRSPRREARGDPYTNNNWRRRSVTPPQARIRQDYYPGENSSRESADNSRRSSPPRSRAIVYGDQPPYADGRSYRGGYSNGQPNYRTEGRLPRGRDSPPRDRDYMPGGDIAPPLPHARSYRNDDGGHDRQPPTGPAGAPRAYGPPSTSAMGPQSGPPSGPMAGPGPGGPSANPILSAPSRPRGGSFAGRGVYSREPPFTGHGRDYGPPPPIRRPSTHWSGPPSSGRGGGGPRSGAYPGHYDGDSRDRERGEGFERDYRDRARSGYDPQDRGFRERGSFDRERSGSMHDHGSRNSYQQHQPPPIPHRYSMDRERGYDRDRDYDCDRDRDRNDRGSSGALQPPSASFRGSSNSTSTTYPRTQRFRDHLADLPSIVPGGERQPEPVDTAKIEKLEDEAQRLRELISEKQAHKRQGLREWEKLEREGEAARLRSELAEESLRGLNGEADMGGPAF